VCPYLLVLILRSWKVDLPIASDATKVDIVCKAVDENHNTQPATVDAIWNRRGLLNNAYHRVTVFPIAANQKQ
jgi:sulfite oxidase